MNITRYVVAGVVSVALHMSLMLAHKEQQVFAMPSGSTSQSVSLNFVAPKASPTEKPSEQQKTDPTPQEKPVVKETAPEVVKKEVVKKKPQPVKKPEPKKVVKKPQPKPAPKKKPVEKVVKQEKTKPLKPEKTEEKKVDKAPSSSDSAPKAVVNSGVSSEPILVTEPAFLSKPVQPRYPRIARKRGIEGVATYEIWLDEKGRQVKQVLISSSGATILDKSALDAIKQWQFSTHTVNGVAMAHRIQIPVRFKLD